MKKILVTGVAGFIGFHLSKRLLNEGYSILGIDNLNNYYDVQLKKDRLKQLKQFANFEFALMDISNRQSMEMLFAEHRFDRVVNLAAQVGIRYSLKDPNSYIESNVTGFMNILEGCRQSQVEHLIYASSSAVYGMNVKMPFSVHDNVEHPLSIYGASKKANELMAHSYSHLFKIPTTGLRFFTVYGPWGRPDMAYFNFTRLISEDKPISIYNYGKMKRDFTYIDDIVEGIVRLIDKIPSSNDNWKDERPDPATSLAPYRLYNIGNNKSVSLMDFIKAIENALGKEAKKDFLPMQLEDVTATWADIDDLMMDVGFMPNTSITEGINKFVEWYKNYYPESVRVPR
ncbi:MAG: NAD-dependent epimerase [Syntrophaceae bacterium]